MNDIRQLITDASGGDGEAFEEIRKAVQVLRALRTLREDRSLKPSLMIIGHNFFDATLQELGVAFKLDKSTVSRIMGKQE